MPLFDTSEKRLDGDIDPVAIKVPTQEQILKLSGRFLSLHTAIGDLNPTDCTIHFVTGGSWSMHDLLEYVLRYTGPAEVRCFTFAWGPDATRTVIKLRDEGKITKLYIVLHNLMKKWTAEAMQIMDKHAERITLTPMHAKGFILENEHWRLSVMGSANFSNNRSIEGGVITTHPEVYAMHRKWLDDLLAGGEVFIGNKMAEVCRETLPLTESKRILFLIRGLPGSGKSSLANIIADEVYENDDWFRNIGNFSRNPLLVSRAEESCFSACRDAMERGVAKLAVANVFQDEKRLREYTELAKVYGYNVLTMTMENRMGTDSIHGFEEDDLRKMARNFRVKLC